MLLKKENAIDKLSSNLFLILYVLWFTLDFVYSTSIQRYSWGSKTFYLQILSILKYALCFYVVAFKQYSLKDWLIIASVSVLFFISARKSGFYELFYGWLFIVASKDVNFEKLVRMTAIMLAVYLPITALLSIAGVIDNTVFYRTELTGSSALADLPRYSFCLEHPNMFGFRLFILILCVLFLKKEAKIKIYEYILIFAAIAFCWMFLNSKTACACILATLLLFACEQRFYLQKKTVQKMILTFMTVTAFLGNIISVLLSVFYTGKGMTAFFNKLLTGRIVWGYRAYSEYGISLFGQKAALTASERAAAGLSGTAYIDCAYHTILFRFGLIVYLVFTLGYLYVMFRNIKTYNYRNMVILMMLALYGIIEQMLYMLTWNVFLMLSTIVFARDDMLQRNRKSMIQRVLCEKSFQEN